jgi:hypothetical protein
MVVSSILEEVRPRGVANAEKGSRAVRSACAMAGVASFSSANSCVVLTEDADLCGAQRFL